MGRWQIGFEYPWLLLLLLLLPVIWILGTRSLAGLGPWRQALALIFRSLVMLLIIFALAGIQWIWIDDRLTVIYLLDQSDSIPAAKRQLMLNYAKENIKAHRNKLRKDRAGLIIFGREASIEFPPLDEDLPPIQQPESYLGKTDATNLEGALKLAQASFPEDSARRVVILTDGNETLGTAAAVAKGMADAGIGIDVVPIRLDSNAEILVEKVDIPGNVRQGQPVDARVVIQKYSENGNEPVDGHLRVTRRSGNRTEVLADTPFTIDREVTVVPIPNQIDQPAGYTYEAQFIPTNASDDAIAQNNRASAFTYARGKGRVLLIEDADHIGQYEVLIEALRRSEIEVEVRDTRQLYSNLIELQSFDAVILAGVPRTSGSENTEIQSFSDEQIDMLVRNTQQFGAGILMLGGPEAFGAGGWANTELEKAMPVDFQIKNSKIEAVGALAMVMHASEIGQGNNWQKVIARSALEVLGPMDYCGVIEFDMLGDKWLWGGKDGLLRVQNNKGLMKSKISAMTPQDMPDFDPSLRMALASLLKVPASTKHMIVISDGDPTPASQGVLTGFANAQIKVSTVAVGAHGSAGSTELQRIATTTGGAYYKVTNASALPKIFMKEARRVARPLVYEPEGGISPGMVMRHPMLEGIGERLPRLRGFVLTQRKESPLVEIPLLSPMPTEQENATILASWTFGLGRTAVFTSDAGQRWAKDWVDWPQYDQFFSQLVRWVMRPAQEEGKFQIATHIRDGKVQVIVNALDKEDGFLNFLDMAGVGVTPDLSTFNFQMRQLAPGRYLGEFDAVEAGSYILSVIPGPNQGILTTGVTVPFSDEYRVRKANLNLLQQLANMKTPGGAPGIISDSLEPETFKQVMQNDAYRGGLPPSKSLKDVWPWAVLLGTTLFFADVFVRRVALDLGLPLRWLASRFMSQSDAAATARQARMERLRSTKSSAHDQMDKQRSNVQFEPEASDVQESGSASESFGQISSSASKREAIDRPSLQNEQESSYTSRLLQAKRDVQRKSKGE